MVLKTCRTLLVAIACLYLSEAKAEAFHMLSIVELSIQSDKVVEATFLKKEKGSHYFLISDLSEKSKLDTLEIEGLEQRFMYAEYSYNQKRVRFENCDKLLIYLMNNPDNSQEPDWTGFRLLKDSLIYLPMQPTNPGGLAFAPFQDRITWEEMKLRARNVHSRVNHIKYLKDIQDPKQRNLELFRWIEKNKNSFGKDVGLNDDVGWGSIEWDVFSWITESNIAQDTWKASQLYREINTDSEIEWRRSNLILREENGISFTTYDDIEFLVSTSLEANNSAVERNQALIFLERASRKVYENNYPIPDSATLAFQAKMQKSIRDRLLPLLGDDLLKENSFRVIKNLSNPRDGNLTHRIDLELIPDIIDLYKQENPGRQRSALAKFIVYNVDTAEWKRISNCDAKIYMDLYQIRVDTIDNTLSFGLYYANGRADIYERPLIIIESSAGRKFIEKEAVNYAVPHPAGTGVRYLKVSVKDLEKGRYKVYIEGRAGKDSQYSWKSEYGSFKIE